MNLVVILGLAAVAAATEVSGSPGVVQRVVVGGKKIEKRSHEVWDPWAPAIRSHYTYSPPVIGKIKIVKPDWSSLSSGWYPGWYVSSPVIVKSSGWSGGWSSGWKW